MQKLLASGKHYELSENCSKILKNEPNNLEAIRYKAYSLYFLGKYKEAIEFYDRAIRLDPRKPSHYSGMSKVLEKLERFEESLMWDRLAKKIKSNTCYGHNNN